MIAFAEQDLVCVPRERLALAAIAPARDRPARTAGARRVPVRNESVAAWQAS